MVLMIRRFQALSTTAEETGMWYAEFDGRFACRQFEVYPTHTRVAPYDVAFVELDEPGQPPSKEAVADIALAAFEDQWERYAQSRLRALGALYRDLPNSHLVRYFRTTFTDAESQDEAGVEYVESVDDIVRRKFEVYPDRTLVAPYDIGLPAYVLSEEELAELAELDELGEEIPIVDIEITLTEFEAAWEAFAAKRLREIAGIAP